MRMRVEPITSNQFCTRFDVEHIDLGNHVVKLLILLGGIPTLSLDDYKHLVCYPALEKYSRSHWTGTHYDHQEQDANGEFYSPPSLGDLPDGITTLREYVEAIFPLLDQPIPVVIPRSVYASPFD